MTTDSFKIRLSLFASTLLLCAVNLSAEEGEEAVEREYAFTPPAPAS
jgi:hypothetical protein